MKGPTLRTNNALDEGLLEDAARLTGILMDTKRRRPLSALRGKIKFAPNYDYKVGRARAR